MHTLLTRHLPISLIEVIWLAGSSSTSTHTVFTGAGRLGDNAGSISKEISGTEQAVNKGTTQSKGSVDTSMAAGHATAKAQLAQGQKTAMAIISRAFRKR